MNICDLHNDFIGKMSINKAKNYIEYCKKCGVKFLDCSLWTTNLPRQKVLKKINDAKSFVCDNFVLHIEDLSFVRTEIELNQFVKYKPFSCSLTWNYDNQFAGGSYGVNNLTEFGKYATNMLQQNNILLDLAHLNRKSFYSIFENLKNPPFVSHAGLDEIVSSDRNLSCEQIENMVRSNGFIGLFFYKKLSTKNRNFFAKNVANNFAVFVEKYGANNIGFGSDFFGIKHNPKDINSYADFCVLERELQNLGFNNNEIEGIFYKNFVRYKSNLSMFNIDKQE